MGFGLDLDLEKVVAPALASVTDAVKQFTSTVLSNIAGTASGEATGVQPTSVLSGATADIAIEPHVVLEANASYEETHFERGPIWIRVDLAPDEAASSTDTLHLSSSAGDYDQTKSMRDFADAQDDTVDVLFEGAPMNQSYTLEVVGADGSKQVVFRDASYGDLRRHQRLP